MLAETPYNRYLLSGVCCPVVSNVTKCVRFVLLIFLCLREQYEIKVCGLKFKFNVNPVHPGLQKNMHISFHFIVSSRGSNYIVTPIFVDSCLNNKNVRPKKASKGVVLGCGFGWIKQQHNSFER